MNAVTFYADINYRGRSWTFADDAAYVGDEANDQFSSVRVPAGTTVLLYEHQDYGGQRLTLTADAADLREFKGPGPGGTWNDAASSVKFSGASSGPVERLKRGTQYVECNAGGTITFASLKADASIVTITKHDDQHYDATFLRANKTLSIQPDGRLESRPAGTYGGYENLDAITAPNPNQISLIYRVDDGVVLGGTVLQIVRE